MQIASKREKIARATEFLEMNGRRNQFDIFRFKKAFFIRNKCLN